MELLETISLPDLEFLIENPNSIIKEERKKFLRYAQLMTESSGKLLVHYAPVAHGYGRVYAEKAMSVQGMSRFIRNHLCHGIYHDIDIENCHPIILSHICQKNGLKCEKLLHYISNREDVLKSIHPTDRSKAKERMLSVIFGSQIKANDLPFVKAFAKEMQDIADSLFEVYSFIPVSNVKSPKFSRMSILLQDMENQILQIIAGVLDENGYRPGVYMYDGLLVYRKEEKEELNVKVLRLCEMKVLEKMELKITLTEKEIKKEWI